MRANIGKVIAATSPKVRVIAKAVMATGRLSRGFGNALGGRSSSGRASVASHKRPIR